MAGDAPKTPRRRSGTHRNPRRFGGLHPATWAAGVLVLLVVLLVALQLSNGDGDNNNATALPDSSRSPLAGTTSSPATEPAPSPSSPPVSSSAPAPSSSAGPSSAPAPATTAPPPPSATPSSPKSPPAPGRQPARPAPPGPGVPWVLYVVRSGDTMWGITDWALGSRSTPARIASSWTRIWAVNRHVIGADPNLIFPGQRFRVPRLG